MNAIILSIGDELVLGQTIDTNSQWLSQQLASVGCDILAHITVGDGQREIEIALREAAPRCDYLIVSGGLGPTEDDLTRQALADVMNAPLEPNAQWLERLQGFFQKRGRPMPERNKIQAMIPRGADMIDNTAGTAPGIHAVLSPSPGTPGEGRVRAAFPSRSGGGQGEGSGNCHIFVMPGVPKEMKIMFARDVLPHIQSHANGAVILSKTLHTFGLGESWVAEKLGPLMDRTRNPSVGTTVSNGYVSLRINARFPTKEEAQRQIDATAAECYRILDDLIFGEGDQTLQEVVGGLLKQHKQTVTTAESCTGGLLAKMLTDLSGSSEYFHEGWVTYSNQAKMDLIGVAPELLAQHGAVSEPVVQAMAAGALQRAKATCALAISGVAGPTGGTPDKPVGTVCLALASAPPTAHCPPPTASRTFNFPGDREMIRDRSAKMALTMLRYHLLAKPMPF